MHGRHICGDIIFCLYELCDGNLSGLNKLKLVQCMSCRFILRINWSDCGNGVMLFGFFLGGEFEYLFKLCCWYLLVIICIGMHELRSRLLYVISKLNGLYNMSRGFILRDDWSISCDGGVRCGNIFCRFVDNLFIL